MFVYSSIVKHYIYNVDKETVLEKISHLQPLNYNAFRWWRRFDTKNKPLHKYSDLLDKIQNGDYEFSHYYWQAKYAELEIDELYNKCYPDYTLFNEKNAMGGARRKRLWDDFEKDEKEIEKRVDIIGQNGNDGLHYEDKENKIKELERKIEKINRQDSAGKKKSIAINEINSQIQKLKDEDNTITY